MQITTMGIVIKEKTVGDDKFLHLLTADYGVITAFARGAKKPRGKLTSSTELFCYSRFGLFSYRDNRTLDTAECEHSFFALRGDLDGLALASYIADLTCEFAPKEEPAQAFLSLLLNTLHLIATKAKPLRQIKPVFELRLLALAGFMPDLAACRECGCFEGGMLFFFEDGVIRCESCASKAKDCTAVAPSVLAAMRHILYSDAKKIFSFILPDQSMGQLNELVEQYLLTHMQYKPKSLAFFHSLTDQKE